MAISDIGSTDDTALLCHTNRPPDGSNSGGNWFSPDGIKVNEDDVPGLIRDRGPMVVRLKETSGTAAQGIYHCSIVDACGKNEVVRVGLYNYDEGTY